MRPEELARRFEQETLDKVKLLRQVAKVVVKNVKDEAPVGKTKRLRNSLRSRIVGDHTVVIAGNKNAPYLPYVVLGTRPHKIRPKTKKALRFKSPMAAVMFAREVQHPGTDPNPFFDRGLEKSMGTIQRELGAMGDAYFRRIAR